jgi:hypothetical protein
MLHTGLRAAESVHTICEFLLGVQASVGSVGVAGVNVALVAHIPVTKTSARTPNLAT